MTRKLDKTVIEHIIGTFILCHPTIARIRMQCDSSLTTTFWRHDLTAYFLGTGASYTETLGLLVNGVATVTGLNNKSTSIGASLSYGDVKAGDTLTFYIDVLTNGDKWYSNSTLNSDRANHVYSTTYTGGVAGVPTGTYVGFEDLPADGSDFNYFDETFVFTNVATTPAVPEPANVALLLAGLGLMGFVARRRRG